MYEGNVDVHTPTLSIVILVIPMDVMQTFLQNNTTFV
jgi:hypothetical protein